MYQQIFSPETFAARRRRVADRIGTGAVALIQGARASGTHDQFRQSNELFYLCGVEVPHAYLLIDGGDGTAALFLPHQDRHSVEAEGEHLSADNAERARELTGVDRVVALEALPAALRGAAAIWTPLSPAEGARSSWDTLRRAQEEANADPFDGAPAREARFAGLLRQRCPAARIAMARPRLRTNHLAMGMVRKSVLLPQNPIIPLNSASPIICQPELMRLIDAAAPPSMRPATASGTREPRLSRRRPMNGPESAKPKSRADSAQPNALFPRPSSSLMGATKMPKLPMPTNMLAPPATPRAATMTHP